MLYRFEDAELDTTAFVLTVRGEPVPVEPQVFEVLAYLVEHRDRLVPRTEILDSVWGDRFVSDSALASRIAAARAAIGDDGRSQRCIKTIHGRGVRFVAPVEASKSAEAPRPAPADDIRQKVKFVAARDGAQLAVATLGHGRPLVKAANWLTHVERDWDSPVWRHWLAEFGRRYEFTRYDSRGCGLSDWELGDVDLSDVAVWMSDLEVVSDQIASEPFVLFGMSQGAIPAMAYAAAHPDRVSHLVLYGAYARGRHRRGPASSAQAKSVTDLMRIGWGGANPAFRSFFTMTFIPEATSEQIRWFNDLQLCSANADNAIRLSSAFHDVDVSDVARRVSVPTLVLHSSGDMATPHEEGRRVAGLIPGAEFTTLDSANHILLADEAAWPRFLETMDEFVGL